MELSASQKLNSPAAVPVTNFMAGSWTAASIAAIFLSVRLYTRLRATRRLFWDDTVLIFGTVFVIAASALWQWAAPKFWFILAVGSGTAFPTDLQQFMKDVEITMRVFFVEQVFFYSTLACVKLSLLLFFRRIGWHMTKIRVAWWSVLGFVVATWLTSIGDSQWGCLVAKGFDIMAQCTEPPAIQYANLTLRINCALDVLSDAAVLSIPVMLIWDSKLRMAKKLAVIGLFSLTLLTMLVAILRVVGISSATWANGQVDPSYVWLWSYIETCIAIIVACLTAFPQLFVSNKKPAPYKQSGPSSGSAPPSGYKGQEDSVRMVQSYGDALDTRVDEESYGSSPMAFESHSITNLKPAGMSQPDPEVVEWHHVSPIASPYQQNGGYQQRYH